MNKPRKISHPQLDDIYGKSMTITATEAPSVVGPINRGLQTTCERLAG